MIWLDTRRGVAIAQFAAQSGEDGESPENTHAAIIGHKPCNNTREPV